MRSYLVPLAVLLVSAAAPVAAADLPTAKPAPMYVPPPFTWTGFYIGLNAGGAWSGGGGHIDFDPTIGGVSSISSGGQGGFAGGAQAGYNIQAGAFVYGIETDIDGVAISEHVHYGPYGVLHLNTSNGDGGWFGTTRARLGYAMDRTLIYVTGGVAYGGLNEQPLNGNATSNVGWTVGGGVEYAFDPHWSVKLEGLYVDLEVPSRHASVTYMGTLYTATSSSSGGGGGVVRAGINYKF
jgi:outer membrane immunogenic protein